MKKNNNKTKKYSLKERYSYYDNMAKKEMANRPMNVPLSKKAQKACGFLQVVERGRPLDFERESPDYKKGVLLGEKAVEKSKNIKF